MIVKKKSTVFLAFASILTGIVYLISGFSKAINIKVFQQTISEYGFEKFSALAPLIVLFEVALAVALIFQIYTKKAALISAITILIFTLLFSYAYLFRSVVDCGCFGSLMPMSPLQALIKNILAMGLIGFQYVLTDKNRDKYRRIFATRAVDRKNIFDKNDATIDKVIEESANIKSDSRSTERKANTKELKTTLKKLQSSSQALLRGVVPLADCYTKGKELRVTVGIKPETINQAANLATAMGNSLSTQPTPNTSNTQPNSGANNNESQSKSNGSNGNNLRSSEGFSNSSRLDNF